LGVKEEGMVWPAVVGWVYTSVVFVALRYDPFVARGRFTLVDARTTTLLDADEQKHSLPLR